AAKHLTRHSQEHSPITPDLPKQDTDDVSTYFHGSVMKEEAGSSLPIVKTWLHSPKLRNRPSRLLWGAMSASLLLHLALLAVPLPEKKVVSSSVSTKKTVNLTTLPQQQKLEILDVEQDLSPTVVQAPSVSPPKRLPAPRQFPPKKSPFEKQFEALSKRPIQDIIIPEPEAEKEPQSQPISTPKGAETRPNNSPPPPKTNDWEDFPLYPQAQPGCFDLPSCMRTEDDLYKVSGFFEQDLAAKEYTFYPVTTEEEKKIYRISRAIARNF
ncbi:MAG: hypothetical protein HC799_18330, partial [Limnothrix sp. RL_2_0]|nr:hypothetical protein [Limnothrix sp. RL_2_0]